MNGNAKLSCAIFTLNSKLVHKNILAEDIYANYLQIKCKLSFQQKQFLLKKKMCTIEITNAISSLKGLLNHIVRF